MGFEQSITRNLYGEKVILSISNDNEEYFFYPKKFSVSGMDEYSTYQTNLQKSISPETTKLLKSIYEKHPDIKNTELLSKMSEEELLTFAKSIPAENKKRENLYRIFLKYGIGNNNLNDKMEEKDGLTEKSIKTILDNNDLSIEIFNSINQFNDFFLTKKN
jgi:hypothetical protein